MVVFFGKSNANTYPKERESTHANVPSCPYNEKREYYAHIVNNTACDYIFANITLLRINI